MRRPILVVAAITAAFVLLAVGTPATAKGPDSATISGPGIGTKQLTMDGTDHSLVSLERITRLWGGAGALWEEDAPAGDLGPRFDLIYHVPDLHVPRKGRLIHQQLYPFAIAGPVVFMPEGQVMYDMAMPTGWLSTGRQLTAIVQRLGGTARAVDSPSNGPATHANDASGNRPTWGLVAGGAAGATLIAAATAALLRRRVTRSRPPGRSAVPRR